jgi:hypothetical protein
VSGRAVPSWQLQLLRRFPRISFAAPVEILCEERTIRGTSRNLSTGGMLLDADCQLRPQTPLWVSFELPTGSAVKASARVVHCRAGQRLGIEFTQMGNADWNALGKAIEIKENYQRRSIRIPERVMVELYWRKGDVSVCQPGQTILLSRHGCLLVSEAAPPPQTSLVIWCLDRHLGAAARVVSCERDSEGLTMVALEFARDANFWGIDFEPVEWQRHRQSPTQSSTSHSTAQY